jgi:predicted AAA+ superfamily ATPase
MIYDHHYNKPFDDGIIRGVDLLVNRAFNRYEDYVAPQLSAYQNIVEYNMLILNLPRQCGKTVYLQKLEAHFISKLRLNTQRITFSHRHAVETDCIGLNFFMNGLIHRCTRNLPEILLFDEVRSSDVQKAVTTYIENTTVAPKFVLALGTSI